MEVQTVALGGGSSVGELIAAANLRLAHAGIDAPRLTAEVLLAEVLGISRTRLFAVFPEPVAEGHVVHFEELLARRLLREPLQYLLGHQEFWSLDFVITPDVLIPRPETERLVELALEAVPEARRGAPLEVCDIGTGSGCLAVTLAKEWPGAQVTAVDISGRALAVAERNAALLGVADRVSFQQGDLFEPLAGKCFDVIVANPPYVSNVEFVDLEPELLAEPRQALVSGDDGLDLIRRLLAGVRPFLRSGSAHLGGRSRLFVEIGAEQGGSVTELARQAGAQAVRVEPDLAGLPRVLCAEW